MSDDQSPGKPDSRSEGLLARIRKKLAPAPRDREEVIESIKQAASDDLFEDDERSMLLGVFDVSDSQVRDVMIPRSHMVVVDRDAKPDELLPVIIESGHSRFPVIGDDRDTVVGILLAKDLLRFFAENGGEDFNIKECLRPAVFIPESKRLNVLLKEFRDSHNHIAIVVDEYGGVSGLLTIEDVLEEIVGEIDDEHDIEHDEDIRKDADDYFTLRALTRIEDFNEYFGADLSDVEYDTLGGLVMHELGRMPRRGESVTVMPYVFEVTRVGRRRIDTLSMRLPATHRALPGRD